MSAPVPVDPALAPVPPQPIAVAAAASGPTPAAAAGALQDAVGGIGADLDRDAAADFAPYRRFLLGGLAVLLAYLLVLFAVLFAAWLFTGNRRAGDMLVGLNTYSAPLAALIVGAVAGWFVPAPRALAR